MTDNENSVNLNDSAVDSKADSSIDSRESSVDSKLDSQDSSIDSHESTPKLSLSEFLAQENLQKINGKYKPNNKQLKELVRYDEVHLGDIDTSEITSMKELFANSTRKDFSGIDKWDTSKVTTFANMFESVEHFNSDISDWNVESAKSFWFMFWNATNFNQPIGAKWHTKSAEGMIGMFCQAKNFNNGGEPFSEKWVMDNVRWTWRMFWGAERFNQPLNDWKVDKVEKMEKMFMGAKAFNQPLDEWNVSSVTDMNQMFNNAESFNQDLSSWGTKLGKVKNMFRAFANTKGLKQTFVWKINENCDTPNITKNSPLQIQITRIGDDGAEQEKEILQDSSQNAQDSSTTQGKKFARNVGEFRIYRVANIPNSLNKLSESKKKDCLYRWIPENIKAKYEIFFAKNSNDKIVSATDLDWEFVYYRVFGYCFAVETDNFELPQEAKISTILSIEQRKDDEEFDGFDFDSHKKDYQNDDIEVILEDKEHIMRIYNGDTTQTNSYRILNLISSLILAKAYETKMEYFNKKARDKQTKLTNCHKEICEFDLQYYQNMPVNADLSVLQFWNQLSQRYNIESKHKELKETIKQVAEIVNERNQKKFNYIMLAVAIFSAIGAILAAFPVIKDL